MFRSANFHSTPLLALTAASLAATWVGCQSPSPPVDCRTQCPCACERDDAPEPTEDVQAMPEKGSTYAVFLAGNVRVEEGRLPLAKARKRVEDQRGALKRCFLQRLDVQPDLKGEVEVQFTVSAPLGVLIAAVVNRDTVNDPALTRCLLKETKTWTFDPQKTKAPSVVKFDIYMSGVDFGKP